jgi:hypothetical protein
MEPIQPRFSSELAGLQWRLREMTRQYVRPRYSSETEQIVFRSVVGPEIGTVWPCTARRLAIRHHRARPLWTRFLNAQLFGG